MFATVRSVVKWYVFWRAVLFAFGWFVMYDSNHVGPPSPNNWTRADLVSIQKDEWCVWHTIDKLVNEGRCSNDDCIDFYYPTVPGTGLHLKNIEDYAKTIGKHALIYSFDRAHECLAHGPCGYAFSTWSGGHSVLLTAHNGTHITVSDSNVGEIETYPIGEPVLSYGFLHHMFLYRFADRPGSARYQNLCILIQQLQVRAEALSVSFVSSHVWFFLDVAFLAVFFKYVRNKRTTGWLLAVGFCRASWTTLLFLTVLRTVFGFGSRFVKPRGKQPRHVNVNDMKDMFSRMARNDAKKPIHQVVGEHRSLAQQRRRLEMACLMAFKQMGFSKVRDVGGSRTRFPQFGKDTYSGGFKHICAAQNHNADILREYKMGESVFDNCRMPGQHCPERHNIVAAMLSHVDYYLPINDLLECITGPTLIINHSFGPPGSKGKLAPFGEDHKYHEAAWENREGLIHMSAPDGTSYQHPHHLWKSEGEIVGDFRAASYVRVASYLDSRVYLAVPAVGMYDKQAHTVLKTSVPRGQKVWDGIDQWLVHRHKGDFVYVNDERQITCPSQVLLRTAAVMASSDRNEPEYLPSLERLLTSNLNAVNRDLITDFVTLRAHTVILADMLLVNRPMVLPLFNKVTWWSRFANRLLAQAPYVFNFLDEDWVARKFADLHVRFTLPGYTVDAKDETAHIGSKKKLRFPNERSRVVPLVNASANNGPSQGADKRGGVDKPESDKPCSGTTSDVVGNEPRDDNHLGRPNGGSAGNSNSGDGTPCRKGSDVGTTSEDDRGYGEEQGYVLQESDPIRQDGPTTCTIDLGSDSAITHHRLWGISEGDVPSPDVRRARLASAFPEGKNVSIAIVHSGGIERIDEQLRGRMSDVTQIEIFGLLGLLPKIRGRSVVCAVRQVMRICGVDMPPCRHHNLTARCFGLRVHSGAPTGLHVPGHVPCLVRGMVLQVPDPETARIVGGAGKDLKVIGTDLKGQQGELLPKERNVDEDDRSQEHLAKDRRVPRNDRTTHQRGRARADKRPISRKGAKSGGKRRQDV